MSAQGEARDTSLRQSGSHRLSPGQSVGAIFRNVETRVPWLFPATSWASGGPCDAEERFRQVIALETTWLVQVLFEGVLDGIDSSLSAHLILVGGR